MKKIACSFVQLLRRVYPVLLLLIAIGCGVLFLRPTVTGYSAPLPYYAEGASTIAVSSTGIMSTNTQIILTFPSVKTIVWCSHRSVGVAYYKLNDYASPTHADAALDSTEDAAPSRGGDQAIGVEWIGMYVKYTAKQTITQTWCVGWP